MRHLQHDMAVKWLDAFDLTGWPIDALLALEYVKECVRAGPRLASPKASTLRDYSTSELMAEYMRRDGCG